MTRIDYTFFFLLGVALVAACYSFARIEKYLIAHRLVKPDAARPDLLDFYKKYMAHTKDKTGRIDRMFWIHIGAAGTFILVGIVYACLRLGAYILSLL